MQVGAITDGGPRHLRGDPVDDLPVRIDHDDIVTGGAERFGGIESEIS
jgi:hypothetical protein